MTARPKPLELAMRAGTKEASTLESSAAVWAHRERRAVCRTVDAVVAGVVGAPVAVAPQALVTVVEGRCARAARAVAGGRTGHEGGDRAPREAGGDVVLGEMRALEVL